MALKNTQKVRLYMHSSSQDDILSFLQENGHFELIESKSAGRGGEAEYSVAKLDFAVRFLSKYAPKRKGIRNAFLGEKIEIDQKSIQKILSSFDWKKSVKTLQGLEGERNDIVRLLSDKRGEISIAKEWEGVQKFESSRFSAVFIRIREKNGSDFVSRIKEVSKYIDISLLSKKDGMEYFQVIAENKDISSIRNILQGFKAEEITLPKEDISIRVKNLESEIIDLAEKEEKNRVKIEKKLPDLEKLKVLYDFYATQYEKEKVLHSCVSEVSGVSIVEGWMIEDSISSVQSRLEKKWKGVEIEKVDAKDGEVAPVELENSAVTKPFSVITKIYGAPSVSEVDPTPFLMPFFIVFFGLCLTDVGYGLLLAGAMGWILFANMPIAKEVKNMIRLLFFAGISTAVFGVLFGGYFGISPTANFVPDAFTYVDAAGNVKFLGQVFMPMEDLMTKIAPLVILMGVIHLLLGVAIKGYISLKNKQIWDVAMVAVPTIATISLGLATLFSSIDPTSAYSHFALLPNSLFEVLKSLTIASFVVMSIGIFKSSGAIGWFMDVAGWLSNTLSYARLFALGLATGIVASVFNMVAFTIAEMLPVGLDIIVIVFIILFGHTLNVALNLLGAFVHSGRLQFVEFFGQFLQGGGRFFSPVKKVDKYVHVQ